MKIFLLILEVLFIAFTIYRNIRKTKTHSRFFRRSEFKLIGAAIALCIINLFVIINGTDGWGYIPDMFFLIFVIIELTFGSM